MTELGRNFERQTLPGGFIQQTLSIKPIAYRGDDGRFRRIVSDWEDSGIPTRPHLISKAPMIISAGNDGMRRIHPTRKLDRYFQIGAPRVKVGGVWRQVNLGAPTRTANLLTWTKPQANMYVRMAGHYIKLAILLKAGWVPEDSIIAFPVGLHGLTRSKGQIFADGVPVMHMRPPHVQDLDSPQDVRPVAHKFVRVGGQWHVLLTLPNLAGMTRPLIDPTLTLQPAEATSQDTTNRVGNQDTNYGTNAQLWTDRAGAHSYLKFDLSTIPASATGVSATLSLWSAESAAGTHTYGIYSNHANVSTWTEMELTWTNYKSGTAWPGSAGGQTSGTDYEATKLADITHPVNSINTEAQAALTIARIEGWFGAGSTNYGIVVPRSGSTTLRDWHSSNAAAAYRPKLVIVYTLPPSAMIRAPGWGRW